MKFSKLAAALLLSAAAPAFAASATFDFSNLSYDSSGLHGLLPSEVLNSGYWKCTDGDVCSSNFDSASLHHPLSGDLVYTVGGVTVKATANYFSSGSWGNAAVVQDHDNAHNLAAQKGAGLGVYHSYDNSDDNITTNERLTLTFSAPVKIDALFMRSDGHDVTHWTSNATFLLNGASTKLAGTINPVGLTGNVFTFQYGGSKADQFYLGGMTVSAVPEPSTYAMLLGGLGLMGLIARRRQARAS